MENALAELETTAIEKIDLDSLVKSAAESLRLIEPWNAARSDHADVSPIIQNIKEQSVVYYRALDLSIKTVEDGYTFSSDSEYLCDFLLDPKNTPEELQEFIDDMRQIARRAHEDAKEMSEMFRGVRQNLNQITAGIPAKVAQVQEQEQRARELTAIAKRRRDQSNLAVAVATAGAGVVGASITIGVAFPPALLILPILLPIFGLISGTVSVHYSRQAERRDTESKSCVDAMRQLHQAAADLSVIVQNVDEFADWWLQMDTMLEAVESKVGQLQANRIPKLRVKSIKSGWGEVKAEYLSYKIKVSKLQDYYPSSRIKGTATSSLAVSRRRQSAITA